MKIGIDLDGVVIDSETTFRTYEEIYDIDILGVSIIQSYRSQFSDLSQSAGFNEITKRLQSVSLDNNTTTK